MESIIKQIQSLETDGETVEYIIRQIGMESQMLRQLIMSMPMEEVQALVAEKYLLETTAEDWDEDEPDLFETPELLPQRVQIVLSQYSDDMTYAQCEALLRRVESMGYTFDYELDATPYNLRPLASQDGPVQ